MSDRVDDVIVRLRRFVAERDWGQFHNPKNLSMAVASEAGELLAEFRWVASDGADAWARIAENRERVAMEAADVGISLLLLCDRVGVDLLDAIDAKIEINTRNYPVSSAKGRHSREPIEPAP